MTNNTRRRWLLLVLLITVPGIAQERKPTPGISGQGDEVSAVKRVLAARQEYQASLEELRAQYLKNGDIEHVRWVEEELLSFHRISKRAFRLDLDVPPPTLTPHQNIPEANELFRRAVTFKSKGWGAELDDNYRRAELLLQQLISLYPQSDKLSETAFHLGEIYESRAFKQYRRAAVYYERSFQWNPQTTNESRIRAARLYDRTLSDSSKAIQIYREEMNRTADPKRLEEARRRLQELGTTPPPDHPDPSPDRKDATRDLAGRCHVASLVCRLIWLHSLETASPASWPVTLSVSPWKPSDNRFAPRWLPQRRQVSVVWSLTQSDRWDPKP